MISQNLKRINGRIVTPDMFDESMGKVSCFPNEKYLHELYKKCVQPKQKILGLV